MSGEKWIAVGGVRIPIGKIRLRFSRSSGPGGQHVNVTESRVELEWDVAGSAAFHAAQRERLLARLAGRIDSRGILHLDCQQTRSQHRNRAILLERLGTLVAAALRPVRRRRPTAPHAAARQRRLTAKAHRSGTKNLRRRPRPEE